MFPGAGATSGLTFAKVVSGISKSLGIANQAIPIYKEVKPIVGKAKGMVSLVSEFRKVPSGNKSANTSVIKQNLYNNKFAHTAVAKLQTTSTKKQDLNSNPVFFQ